jgi:hypothetical protein
MGDLHTVGIVMIAGSPPRRKSEYFDKCSGDYQLIFLWWEMMPHVFFVICI